MTNERSLSNYAGLEGKPKVVLPLPKSEPFHNLWLNSRDNKLAPLPGTRLNIIPGKNDKDSKDKDFLWANRYSYM